MTVSELVDCLCEKDPLTFTVASFKVAVSECCEKVLVSITDKESCIGDLVEVFEEVDPDLPVWEDEDTKLTWYKVGKALCKPRRVI